MIQAQHGFSGRRACRLVGQHRSTQRRCPEGGDLGRNLRAWLCRFARDHQRWGYRRAHAVLIREGHQINPKKIQLLWRDEGAASTAQTLQAPASRQLHHPSWPTESRASQPRPGPRLPVRRDLCERCRSSIAFRRRDSQPAPGNHVLHQPPSL